MFNYLGSCCLEENQFVTFECRYLGHCPKSSMKHQGKLQDVRKRACVVVVNYLLL